MPTTGQIHGKNGVLYIWDSGGTCRNMSGDFNNISLSWTRDNPDTTTFSNTTVQRIAGLYDAVMTGAAIYNVTDTTGVDAVLTAIMAASINTMLAWAPAGSISGSPLYTGCFLLSAYNPTGPVNGPVAAAFTFQIASGSLTTGCVA